MRAVLKHGLWASEINADGIILAQLAPNAIVRHVGYQPNPAMGSDLLATVWAEGDVPDRGLMAGDRVELWEFAVVGTGYPVPAGYAYYGSTFAPPFVWHVYGRPQGDA